MLNKDVFKKYDENFMKDNQNAAKMEIGPKERPYFVPRDISFDEHCNDRRYPVLDKLWVPGKVMIIIYSWKNKQMLKAANIPVKVTKIL